MSGRHLPDLPKLGFEKAFLEYDSGPGELCGEMAGPPREGLLESLAYEAFGPCAFPSPGVYAESAIRAE
jgi:hypothetical protein